MEKPANPPTPHPGLSKLFAFVRSAILAKHSGSAVARRSGTQAPTIYRWKAGDFVPDQLVLLERILAAYGYGITIRRLTPPDVSPLDLEVPDEDDDAGATADE